MAMPTPPPGPKSPDAFRLLPTPDPDVWSFATTHDQSSVYVWPTKYQTVYKEWGKDAIQSWKHTKGPKGVPFGDYIFTDTTEGPVGSVTFLWAMNKTEEEKNTPFRTTQRFGNHHWPPMLLQVKILEDNSFPQATLGPSGKTIFGPRYFDRTVYIPSADEGSLFIEEEFISPTPFEIGQYPVPTANSVSYSYLGIQGSFPECLHPKLVFPSKRMATSAYSTGEGNTGAAGALTGQVFPETNFTEWAPYILSHNQQPTNGVYYAKKTTVFPPPIPETIVQ